MTSSAIRRGCFAAVLLVAAGSLAVLAVLLIPAWRLPQDAPLAQMYRTEADLTVLVKALDTYRAGQGGYPPAGPEGLRMATDYLSKTGHYMPQGPPTDGWDRPFVYVPSEAYAAPGSVALSGAAGYFAPSTYQVYSLGADGAAGLRVEAERADNITSWESVKPWRTVYRKLNADFMAARRVNP